MSDELVTFRNGVASIFQSALEDWQHQVEGKDFTPTQDLNIIILGRK